MKSSTFELDLAVSCCCCYCSADGIKCLQSLIFSLKIIKAFLLLLFLKYYSPLFRVESREYEARFLG